MTPFNFLVLQYENGEINEQTLLETMKGEHMVEELNDFGIEFKNWVDSIAPDEPHEEANKLADYYKSQVPKWHHEYPGLIESCRWENFKYEWYGNYELQEFKDFMRGYFLGGSATKSAYK